MIDFAWTPHADNKSPERPSLRLPAAFPSIMMTTLRRCSADCRWPSAAVLEQSCGGSGHRDCRRADCKPGAHAVHYAVVYLYLDRLRLRVAPGKQRTKQARPLLEHGDD